MKILIAGGTSFVGRAIAQSASRTGNDVTVINRGVTPNDLPDSIHRLIGDRQGDLSALAGHHFDVTIDTVAYRPSDVTNLARALDGRGGHHIQISSVSSYEDPTMPGGTEATLRLLDDPDLDPMAPVTGATYGPLKAACERTGAELFETTTFIRPTYVIGSHDKTLRFPYWVERVLRGGEVAVPGPRANVIQYIDARDLADFVVVVAQKNLTGAFHTAGPFPADHYVEMIESVARQIAPPGTEIVEVSPKMAHDQGLNDKFPLWSGSKSENISNIDSSLAITHGLNLRPIQESIDDVVAWWGDRDWPSHWLTSDQESMLLSSR